MKDERVSNGLFVFSESSGVLNSVAVGDLISLSGVVQDFRSSSDPTFIRDTELDSPTDIKVISTGHTVKPVILGVDRTPPTLKYSALDVGPDGFLSVPNNQSQIDTVNATLRPREFGVDFWASLEGQLVTVPKPISIAFNNRFGEFWVRGDWPATSVNSRGGLTITIGMFPQFVIYPTLGSFLLQAPTEHLMPLPKLSLSVLPRTVRLTRLRVSVRHCRT